MTSRILAALAALIVSAGSAEAGVLTYSGYLLDPQGKPVTTSTTLQFRFYPGSAGGAVIWEDVVVVAPGADGWFSAVLGASGANPLDAADFAQQLWLAIKVSTDAQEMSPRMRIGTAPYALTVPWDGVQGKPTSFPVDPATVQSRVTGTCAAGQFMTGVGEAGTVTCAADASGTGDVTGVFAGTGLTGGGLAGDLTLAVDFTATQARVTGACPAGQLMAGVNQNGTVVCAADTNSGGDITGVSAGTGLTGGGPAGEVGLAADLTVVQARVAGTCLPGQFMVGVNANGGVACSADANSGGDITSVAAGFGLTGGGLSGDATLAVNTAAIQERVWATCPAGMSIRAIDAAGGVTCELDDNTTYAPGSGIALAGTTFSTDNTVVARKDAAAGNQTFDGGTLHVDYANNRVGVGTTIPAVPLHVNGVARASSYQLNTPLAGKFFIAGNSMTPNLDFADEQWRIAPSGYGHIGGGISPFSIPLSGAINIPNGATLTSLFCEYLDNDAANGVAVSAFLVKRPFGSTVATNIGALTASTSAAFFSSSILTVSDTTVSTPLIDNLSNHYYFYVGFSNAPAVTTSLRLYGCGVTYTYSSLTD